MEKGERGDEEKGRKKNSIAKGKRVEKERKEEIARNPV